MKSGGNRYNPDMKKMYQLERIYTQGEIADMEKKDDLELRICKMLQEATENEDLSKGFYKDLEFTSVDENYIRSLLDGQKRKKKVFYMKICKIVASVAIFFILAGVMATWISDGSVSAVKGKISQLFIEDNDDLLMRNEGISTIDNQVTKSYLIEDWNDIKTVKKKFPGLYVPEYIPDSYNFKKLVITSTDSDYLFEYTFSNNTNKIYIKQYSVENYSLDISNYDEVISVDNLEIYFSNASFDESIMATYINDVAEEGFCISGYLDKDEILNIIKKLNK